jgi:hypothetical protein
MVAAEQARLDRVLESQAADGGWARDYENEITRSLNSEALREDKVTELGCRRSLCRMRIRHASKSTYESFVESFIAVAPPNQGLFARRTGDEQNGYETVLFLARLGSNDLLTPADAPQAAAR